MNILQLSPEHSTNVQEMPHARAKEELGVLATRLLASEIPGFTVATTAFGNHTTTEGFAAIDEHFPGHALTGTEQQIGTEPGPDEIMHTDRKDQQIPGAIRLHRVEPSSPSGAHISLGHLEGNPTIAPGTIVEYSSSPDALEATYHQGHAAPGDYTVFKANNPHRFTSDRQVKRSSIITDTVQQ